MKKSTRFRLVGLYIEGYTTLVTENTMCYCKDRIINQPVYL